MSPATLSRRLRHLGISLFIALLVACATSPTGRSQLMLVSEGQAIAAAKVAYQQTLQELGKAGKLSRDKALNQRVQRITDRLIQQAILLRPETRAWDWQIEVIDDPKTVNAWCMAGGRMAIYTGLIEQLQASDDELAQVLGHEIAHALAKHAAEQMSVAMATALGMAAVGSMAEEHQQTALATAALAAKLAIQLPNSRTAEREADRIGIELAAKAGYDPRAAVSLWQKMAQVGGSGGIPEFLSTHPSPANREETLRRLVPKMRPYYEQARASASLKK